MPTIAVSPSSLGTYRACPKKYEYSSLRRLRPAAVTDLITREFGSWWHALRAADAIARSRVQGKEPMYLPDEVSTGDKGPVLPVTDTLTGSDVLLAAARYWQAMPADDQERWLDKMGAPLPEHLAEMDRRWEAAWGRESRENEVVLAVEVQFEVPIADTGVVLRGRVDEVYYDKRLGLVVVRDHKTNGTIATTESLDDLLDSQLHLYAWGVSVHLKIDVKAVGYDRARSKPAAQPAVTKAGKLSASVTDYDLDKYLDFTEEPVPFPGLKKDGSGAGEYLRDPKVVEKLQAPGERDKWNRRTLDPVNPRMVRGHLQEAVATAEGQAEASRRFNDPTRGPVARNLSRTGCKGCDFVHLCLDEMRTNRRLEPGSYGLAEKA